MTLLDAATSRAGAASRPALRRLLPVPVEQFAAEYWGERALLSRAATLPGGPHGFADLLSLAAVDDLVSTRGLRTPFVRVAKDGEVIDAVRWTGPGGAGAEIADQVRDDALLGLFADGATLVLQGLHRTHPPLVRFAADLAVELGHPVQVNAYITPPQSRGFDAHYDVHDVFVLQVAGRKRWRISRPVLEHPLRSQPWTERRAEVAARAVERAYIDEVLEPGDALYLPRGWLHAAEALGEVSAHVTVGVHTVTRYALAEQLLAASIGSAELRRSLPLGVDVADADDLREDLAATLEALAAAVREVPAEQVAERMRARVWGQSRPGPVAPIAQAAAAAALDEATPVVLRPALRARLVRRGHDTVTLVLPTRTLTLPASTTAALEAVLAGDPVTAGTLPGLDGADGVVLLRRLLREAVVVPAAAADS
jgi:bifunctional lysine-specific demethylase and histidyl-hydroxylase NO66